MELIKAYVALKTPASYLLRDIAHLWKANRILATPKIAKIIEERAKITRHDFNEKCVAIVLSKDGEYDNETLANAIMAFIIYGID